MVWAEKYINRWWRNTLLPHRSVTLTQMMPADSRGSSLCWSHSSCIQREVCSRSDIPGKIICEKSRLSADKLHPVKCDPRYIKGIGKYAYLLCCQELKERTDRLMHPHVCMVNTRPQHAAGHSTKTGNRETVSLVLPNVTKSSHQHQVIQYMTGL